MLHGLLTPARSEPRLWLLRPFFSYAWTQTVSPTWHLRKRDLPPVNDPVMSAATLMTGATIDVPFKFCGSALLHLARLRFRCFSSRLFTLELFVFCTDIKHHGSQATATTVRVASNPPRRMDMHTCNMSTVPTTPCPRNVSRQSVDNITLQVFGEMSLYFLLA